GGGGGSGRSGVLSLEARKSAALTEGLMRAESLVRQVVDKVQPDVALALFENMEQAALSQMRLACALGAGHGSPEINSGACSGCNLGLGVMGLSSQGKGRVMPDSRSRIHHSRALMGSAIGGVIAPGDSAGSAVAGTGFPSSLAPPPAGHSSVDGESESRAGVGSGEVEVEVGVGVGVGVGASAGLAEGYTGLHVVPPAVGAGGTGLRASPSWGTGIPAREGGMVGSGEEISGGRGASGGAVAEEHGSGELVQVPNRGVLRGEALAWRGSSAALDTSEMVSVIRG
ncbi:unnamed protein product, partial [Discosporangium mesarthrocarpum]